MLRPILSWLRLAPPRATVLRGAGAIAAVFWVAVALDERAEWRRPGLLALGIALASALALRPVSSRVPAVLLAPPRWAFVGVCAIASAALSVWALRSALGGQVLSIDSGIYVLEARALAHGSFGIPTPHPMQAFGDRFVLEGPDGRLYGIFPPGWPLALAPFVAAGMPMAAGPVVAVALTLATAALGRALARASGDERGGELATRVALLLSLASIGRALETADLLSHAFVAALVALAMAGALELGRPERAGSKALAVGLGACVGWTLAARLLDGVLIAAAVGGILAWTPRRVHVVAWATLGAAPFVALLLLEQHAATGRWLTATQSLYFERSDWPPTCHRLGFGADVGCTVEHPGPVSRLGGDGYDLGDALRVTRERAGSLGQDLFGWGPLALAAFVPVALAASGMDACALAFVLALTLAYALFYYGNAKFFGARHLFPAAAFFWLLAARGAVGRGRTAWAQGVGLAVLLAVAVTTVRRPWTERFAGAVDFQAERSDLRRVMREHDVDRGIVKTHDLTSFAAAFDPWDDDDRRIVALDDDSGLVELRRAHPDLPVLLSLPAGDVGRLYPSRPRPGVLVELERSWPTFVRPSGLAVRQTDQDAASGGEVLRLSHASPGASIEIAFETAVAATYVLRVDVFTGPDEGNYALALDGEELPAVRGYSPERRSRRGEPRRIALPASRHVLVATCQGADPASSGFDARLDALVGEPVE